MGVHLVTASYTSDFLKSLESEAKSKGLIFITECGLDPGLDHIMAKLLQDKYVSEEESIVEYESWCGGLISPEYVDNPLGYKFSWSPLSALLALQNPAHFLLKDSR